MKITLKSLDVKYCDIQLPDGQFQNNSVILGRGPLTCIRDKRCSKNQVLVKVKDYSQAEVTVCQIGPNVSRINRVNLKKNEETPLKEGDVIYLLAGQFPYRLTIHKNESKNNKDDCAVKREESKKTNKKCPLASMSPIKQTTVTDFFTKTGSTKRKLSEQNGSKDKGIKFKVGDSESEDEEHMKQVETNLKRLKQDFCNNSSVSHHQPIKCSKSDSDDKVEKSYWETHDEYLLYSSKGVKASAKIAAFDVDNTIIKTKSGRVFPVDTNDWEILMSKVPEKLKSLSNDGYKIVFFSNQMSVGKGKISCDAFKRKIEEIISELNIPIQTFVAIKGGYYRKPAPGMWKHLVDQVNSNIVPDMLCSFYVGDAAGRKEKFLPGRKKDFACSDRLFSMNVGIKFYTPEEYFLGHKPAPYSLPGFDPRNICGGSLLNPSSAVLKSDRTEVIVMVGMAASGKSHFVQNYLVPEGYVHVNRDRLGSWKKCVDLCKQSLAQRRSVVIDNMNPDVESRKRYVDCAKSMSVSCRCFVVDVSLEWARHNNKFRQMIDTERNHVHVSDTILYSFRKNFKDPELCEGFQQIIKVNFLPKFQNDHHETLYKMFLLEK